MADLTKAILSADEFMCVNLFYTPVPAFTGLPNLVAEPSIALIESLRAITNSRPAIWPWEVPYDCHGNEVWGEEHVPFAEWANDWNQALVTDWCSGGSASLSNNNVVILSSSILEGQVADVLPPARVGIEPNDVVVARAAREFGWAGIPLPDAHWLLFVFGSDAERLAQNLRDKCSDSGLSAGWVERYEDRVRWRGSWFGFEYLRDFEPRTIEGWRTAWDEHARHVAENIRKDDNSQ